MVVSMIHYVSAVMLPTAVITAATCCQLIKGKQQFSAYIINNCSPECVFLLFAAKSRAMEKKLVQVIEEEDEVMMEN